MGNLCNDNSKETNAYQEFLACKKILVITLPSRFLNIVQKYNPKRPEQAYRLYTDAMNPIIGKADAVLVDNSIQGYYEFAKYVKRYVNPSVKFFVLVDDKYITDLRITDSKPRTFINTPNKKSYGKRNK